jgi:exoribonuclease-2
VDVPLVISLPGVKHPRGTQVRLELISWDELDLTVQARVLEVSNAGTDLVDDMGDESALPEAAESSASSDDAPSSDASEPSDTTELADASVSSDAAAASESQATSQANSPVGPA